MIKRTIALLLAICLSPGGHAATTADHLRRANSGEPISLDPHRYTGSFEAIALNDLFTGLTTADASGNIVPGLALRYTTNESRTRYRFELRRDLLWSDGTPLTAQDFVYSIRRALDPQTASVQVESLFIIRGARAAHARRGPLDKIGVSAPEPHIVQFELDRPAPEFPEVLSQPIAAPVPRHQIARFGNDWTRAGRQATSGPYVLEEWVPLRYLRLRRNARFYDAASVRIARIDYLPIENLEAGLRMFRAGALDIALNFPPGQLSWIRENLPRELRVFPILGTYYFALNHTSPPLGDVRVRKALSLAVDREVLVEKALAAGDIAAYSLVPKALANYPRSGEASFRSLPMAARRGQAVNLLRAAGYDSARPLQLELSFGTTEENKRVAVAVSAMWGAIGVRTRIRGTELKVHLGALEQGQFQIGRASMFMGIADASDALRVLRASAGRSNYGGYSSEVFEQAFDRAERSTAPGERAQLFANAEAIAMADVAVIPVFHYVSKRLVSTRVRGFVMNSRGSHPSRYLSLEP